VRADLLQLSQVGLPSVDAIGRRLGMSARTLQRRLREAGERFDAVSRQVLSTLTEAYLRDPSVTISEVAYLLAFSESSAFSRAFKAWTGEAARVSGRARSRERLTLERHR